MKHAKYLDDFEHVNYDFICVCPRCKQVMEEIRKHYCCLKCGMVIDMKTNEIK